MEKKKQLPNIRDWIMWSKCLFGWLEHIHLSELPDHSIWVRLRRWMCTFSSSRSPCARTIDHEIVDTTINCSVNFSIMAGIMCAHPARHAIRLLRCCFETWVTNIWLRIFTKVCSNATSRKKNNKICTIHIWTIHECQWNGCIEQWTIETVQGAICFGKWANCTLHSFVMSAYVAAIIVPRVSEIYADTCFNK